jgi:oligosaccharide repeat unit polymerase
MVKQGLSAAKPARARAVSTAVILCGLALTSFSLPSDGAVNIFTMAAVSVGLSLSLATGIEATAGIRNLIRVDMLMLWVLYLLTFMEFLFPQQGIDAAVSAVAATSGTNATLLGFGGLAVGRHLALRGRGSRRISPLVEMRPASILLLFTLATLLGYLYMFLAVNFDPLEVFRQMSQPRFTKAWVRGRYGGDIFSLLVELGALTYLIPPIAGLIYARSNEYSFARKAIVTIVLLFTLYYAVTTGTRNVIGTHVITFFGAYYLNIPKLKLTHVLYQGIPALALLLLISAFMLEFRQSGFSSFSFETSRLETLSVDYNMIVISKLTEVFPSTYDFLGFELPFNALIHPIPRILWPGKPEGLSVGVESALGADGAHVTLAATFVGEAYMSGGLLAVLFAGLACGAAARMWNRLGRTINSPFAQLLYASGFFCAMLVMRSITWATVTVLPTLALWLYGKLFLGQSPRRRLPSFMPAKTIKIETGHQNLGSEVSGVRTALTVGPPLDTTAR